MAVATQQDFGLGPMAANGAQQVAQQRPWISLPPGVWRGDAERHGDKRPAPSNTTIG